MNRKIVFISLILLFCTLFTSCSSDNGKNELCELLLTDGYSMAFDFTVTEKGEVKISGSACATKENDLCIAFSSPDILNGLSVTSDSGGNADTLSFSYYGMKAPLPSGALSDINTIMSFFSDETAMLISSLPKKAASLPDSSDGFSEGTSPISLTLVQNENEERVLIYDAKSGSPLSFTVKKNDGEIKLDFTKIKRPTPRTE